MHTYLPFADYTETAKVMPLNYLVQMQTNLTIIIKRNVNYYEDIIKEEKVHQTIKFWRNYEVQLAYFGLALAEESIKRPLSKGDEANSLSIRRNDVYKWETIIDKLEELEFPNDKPSLIGDEEFHSAFRSLLLFKGCQVATFKKWKRGEYIDHISTRNLLPKKTSWRRDDYMRIWEFFGMPDSEWYSQFGWTEVPNDLLYFYKEDRIPFMLKELERKKKKPVPPYFAGRKTWDNDTNMQT